MVAKTVNVIVAKLPLKETLTSENTGPVEDVPSKRKSNVSNFKFSNCVNSWSKTSVIF